ncbi:hypothetical protein NHG32_07285 [Aerococcaceae bacterium NML191219]|nr:hypothetical protein [Aerococcaceae bacterium NML191219]
MKTVAKKTREVISKYTKMYKTGMYDIGYLQSEAIKEYENLRKESKAVIQQHLSKLHERLNELKRELSKVIEPVTGIDELLRRQELDLRISLMADNHLKQMGQAVLLNEHYAYDELLLEAEFNKRGLGDDYNSILLERTTSMQSNETYKQTKEEMDMINLQIGFGGEVLHDNQQEIQLIDEDKFIREIMGR